MAEQETTPTVPPSRSAKFKRHSDSEVMPTDMTLGRRAEFRPSEQIAVRRDVLEAYRQGLLRDIAGTSDSDEVRDRAMFAAALADEATRNHDRAAMQLARLRRQTDFYNDEWAVVRRVHRRLNDFGVVSDALERSFAISRGAERALIGLERARHGWQHGEEPHKIARWVRGVMNDFDEDGRKGLHKMPRMTAAWAVQLATDAAVEAEHYDRALTVLDAFLDHPELSAHDRQMVAATLGLWNYALGNPDEATRYLNTVGEQGVLHRDFEDAWVHLLFADGQRDHALGVLRRSADRIAEHGAGAVVLAQLEAAAGNAEAAVEALSGVRDDQIVLDLSLQLLEASDDSEELINVLNQRIETETEQQRRAALLARLGRLYEAEAGLEEAAADVYREALDIVPDYAPAIRALGRLYSRRKNWVALVDLFEHEIDSLHGSPTVWRRQFQVARLYENELADFEHALQHYLSVLDARPDYLPALKGAARILAETERWSQMCDLFLEAAPSAVSNRQKLYLLDRVAEVAEQKLDRFDIAIGAWEEILHMDPLHPRAFSSLGRLYARTHRWGDLVELNERELEHVDDEEAAALLVRNAEIAEQHLARPDLAEANYRRVLERLPDYLPALEGLGRIYARGGRWGELIGMTDAQLEATTDPREARRQLGALAELYEGRLDRTDDAIRVYERMLGADARDSWSYFNLVRLYAKADRWQNAYDVIRAGQRPGFEGELAMIAEFKLSQWDTAFSWYLHALEKDPANEHWLEGVQRLWRPSEVDPTGLADRLEALLMSPMEAWLRDRYFIVLARLREAAEGTPDAGRAYRAHGDTDNLESLVVLRLSMAASAEREGLLQGRRTKPLMPWDGLVNADRSRPPAEVLEALGSGELEESERQFLTREMDLAYSRPFVKPGDGAWTELAAEMQRVLGGPPDDELQGDIVPELLRLRAVEALEADDIEQYLAMTAAECDSTPSRQVTIYRHLEAAEALGKEARAEYLVRAVEAAFPELGDESFDAPDGPVYDRLYQVLEENEAWTQLGMALRTHVARAGLSDTRAVYLNGMLARVCGEHLEELDEARRAWERCWAISQEPQYLRDLVHVAREDGDFELAVSWQTRHYESMEHSSDAAIESALWLADLLRLAGKGEEAVRRLELLVDPPKKAPIYDAMLRELARLHVDFGDSRRAVELFQSVLPIHAVADDAEDWRTLIRLQRDVLNDSATAYALQWKLVRSIPDSDRDLDDLVDFALDLAELPDCCAQLQALAGEHEGKAKVYLLGRAAVALDEDLNWAEDAVRLYEEVLKLTDGHEALHRAYRRRYAFCLSRITGSEAHALEEFRMLADEEPFEPSTYRGIVDLLERTQAYDRARMANQMLAALGCHVDAEFDRPKTTPSRDFEPQHIEEWLLPGGLRGGVLGCLRSVMPIAEKIWAAELPQRKAFDGDRHKDGRVYDAMADALTAFGIKKFKLYTGDSGPRVPQVFGDGTIWLNADVIEPMSDAELRFVAGACAALAWSDIASILALDGRRLWHLLEGVQLKHDGRGFSDRVDVASQQLGEEVGSAFYAVSRRRVAQALEVAGRAVTDAHCEAWGQDLDSFAYRVGLVVCGDTPASVSALLRLSGWEPDLESSATQARLRRTNNAADLMRFAFSDAYLEARHAIGLAGRPTSLDP